MLYHPIRCTLLLLAIYAIHTPMYAQTINETLSFAISNSPYIKELTNKLESSKHQSNSYMSGFKPTLSLEYNSGRQDYGINDSRFASNSGNGSINFTQPLFNGFSTIYDRSKDRLNYLSSLNGINHELIQALYEILLVHRNLCRITSIMKVQKRRERNLKAQLNLAKNKYKNGALTLNDVIQARIELAESVTETLEYQLELQKENSRYFTHTKVQPKSIECLSSTNLIIPKYPEDLKTNNFEYKSKILLTQSLEYDVKSTKSKFWPSISFNAQYSFDNFGGFDGKSQISASSAFITVSYPLFEQGQSLFELKEKQFKLSKNILELKTLELKIKEDFDVNVFKMNRLKKIIEIKRLTFQNSIKLLNGYLYEFKLGSKSISDLLEAESKQYTSEISLINSYEEYFLTYIDILILSGSFFDRFELKKF